MSSSRIAKTKSFLAAVTISDIQRPSKGGNILGTIG
jgi:hypothetical protein